MDKSWKLVEKSDAQVDTVFFLYNTVDYAKLIYDDRNQIKGSVVACYKIVFWNDRDFLYLDGGLNYRS